MLDYTKKDLQELGAEITTREIYQQPRVWKETARLYQERKAEIKAFLEKIGQGHLDRGRDLSLCGRYLGSILAGSAR